MTNSVSNFKLVSTLLSLHQGIVSINRLWCTCIWKNDVKRHVYEKMMLNAMYMKKWC